MKAGDGVRHHVGLRRQRHALSRKRLKGIVNLAAHQLITVDRSGKIANDPGERSNDDGIGTGTLTQMEIEVQDNLQKNDQISRRIARRGKSFCASASSLISIEDDGFANLYAGRRRVGHPQPANASETVGTSTQPGGLPVRGPGYVEQINEFAGTVRRKENTTNYEVNEEKRKVVASPGSIRRPSSSTMM